MSLIKDIVNSQLELVSNINIIDNILNTVNSDEKTNPITSLINSDNDNITTSDDYTSSGTDTDTDTEVYEEDEEEEGKQLQQQ
jgi:hypothetical protein